MSCELTATLVADYLDDGLVDDKRQHYDEHLAHCAQCQAQLASLSAVYNTLHGWQSRAVPEWPRKEVVVTESAPQSLRGSRRRAKDGNGVGRHAGERFRRWSALRWLPLAASLLLAVAVVMQTRVHVDDAGWTLSFGTSAPQPDGSADGAVTRPDPNSVREVYALSLEGDEPPRSVGTQPGPQADEFESQLFAVMCASADILRLPEGEHVMLVMPVANGTGSQGTRGERRYRLSDSDLQACQRGDIDTVTLQQRASEYRY